MTSTTPLLTAYVLNPAHRIGVGNSYKSIWTISPEEEEVVFHFAYNALWIDDENHVWGLHIVNGVAQNLGVPSRNAPHANPLFIGKFLDDDGYGQWHGYPADHKSNGTRDIPPSSVRKQWLTKKYVRKSVITMLSRGKSCAL